MIISASRRTDIPAFYTDWLLRRLRSGYCLVANPWNARQVSRVSLAPADVDVIVFWSKNPAPLVARLDELDRLGHRYCFLFTLNDYPVELEPALPGVRERIELFRGVSARIGSPRVVWRYDPIILSSQLDGAFHAERFGAIAEALRGCTQRVIISLVDFYRKTERRLRQVASRTQDRYVSDPFDAPGLGEMLGSLTRSARRCGMQIQSCAEDARLGRYGVAPGACVDAEMIHDVFGVRVARGKDRGQRDLCRCAPSRDIGAPDSCPGGCEYCYATVSAGAAQRRRAQHRVDSPLLIGEPPAGGDPWPALS